MIGSACPVSGVERGYEMKQWNEYGYPMLHEDLCFKNTYIISMFFCLLIFLSQLRVQSALFNKVSIRG